MKNISNHGEFSWAELFSDQNGKTSGTSFTGIIICMVGTLCFLLGCIDKMWISKSIDVITQSITFVLIGASLMGLKKVVGSKSSSDDSTPTVVDAASQPQPQPQPQPAPDPNPPAAKAPPTPPTADEPPLD
jgi:hypothetical protein